MNFMGGKRFCFKAIYMLKVRYALQGKFPASKIRYLQRDVLVDGG